MQGVVSWKRAVSTLAVITAAFYTFTTTESFFGAPAKPLTKPPAVKRLNARVASAAAPSTRSQALISGSRHPASLNRGLDAISQPVSLPPAPSASPGPFVPRSRKHAAVLPNILRRSVAAPRSATYAVGVQCSAEWVPRWRRLFDALPSRSDFALFFYVYGGGVRSAAETLQEWADAPKQGGMLAYAAVQAPRKASGKKSRQAEQRFATPEHGSDSWATGRNALARAIYHAEVARGLQFGWWAMVDGDMAELTCAGCGRAGSVGAAASACCFLHAFSAARSLPLAAVATWPMASAENTIEPAETTFWVGSPGDGQMQVGLSEHLLSCGPTAPSSARLDRSFTDAPSLSSSPTTTSSIRSRGTLRSTSSTGTAPFACRQEQPSRALCAFELQGISTENTRGARRTRGTHFTRCSGRASRLWQPVQSTRRLPRRRPQDGAASGGCATSARVWSLTGRRQTCLRSASQSAGPTLSSTSAGVCPRRRRGIEASIVHDM